MTITTYFKAQSVHKIVQGTKPKELWSGTKPIVEHLQMSDYDAYIHGSTQTKTKLYSKAIKCGFMGHNLNFKSVQMIDEETSKLIISYDVVFNENFGNMNSNDVFCKRICLM
jgi:hypothetical protein